MLCGSSGSADRSRPAPRFSANLVELLVDGQKHELILVSPSTVGRLALSFNAPADYYFGTLSTQPGPTSLRSAAFVQNGDIVLSAASTIRTLPSVSSVPVGGPFFDRHPDILTFFVFNQSPTPGNILAWSGSANPAPLTVPQFGMAPFFGQAWDVVGVAFGGGFNFIVRTNMQRVTWN
ncbi:MAG: hypothetical protein ACI89X_003945 [Planctomycetota bacterium]|jgi:hypothetical protein